MLVHAEVVCDWSNLLFASVTVKIWPIESSGLLRLLASSPQMYATSPLLMPLCTWTKAANDSPLRTALGTLISTREAWTDAASRDAGKMVEKRMVCSILNDDDDDDARVDAEINRGNVCTCMLSVLTAACAMLQ